MRMPAADVAGDHQQGVARDHDSNCDHQQWQCQKIAQGAHSVLLRGLYSTNIVGGLG
jgi:hypothetical protein